MKGTCTNNAIWSQPCSSISRGFLMKRRALITGVTGQDGSYLSELLLAKGYEVHGVKRRSSSLNTQRLDHIYEDPHSDSNFFLHYGDLSDSENISKLINIIRPDEIYNLGAQSHVAVSFEIPEYTSDIDALGTLRILEAIKSQKLIDRIKFYQASSSELFGLVQTMPQNEFTPFHPRSPYAVAKLYAYWMTINFREAYGLFAANGILFNHESPRRGETFVTRKITRGIANISMGLDKCLYLGNLDAKRDWGHAKDYVYAQWLILQQERADDYVIATGVQYSVREFALWTAEDLGITIEFQGSGLEEVGIVTQNNELEYPSIKIGDVIVRVDPRYFRPAEVDTLCGDSGKARKVLGWSPSVSARDLCSEMIVHDINIARRNALLMKNGFVPIY